MSYPAIDMIKSAHTSRQFTEVNPTLARANLLPPAPLNHPKIDFPLFLPIYSPDDELYFIKLLLLSTTSDGDYAKDNATFQLSRLRSLRY